MSETTGHRFELSWLGWRTIDARSRRVRIARFFRGVDRDAFEEQAILRWKNSCFEDSFGYEGVERGLWMQCIYAAFALVIATPLTGYAIILAMTNIEPNLPAIALLMTSRYS